MMNTQPTYSTEFKIDAANLVIKQGYSVREVFEATGVGPTEFIMDGTVNYS
ncbi:hypothetical protein JK628_15210 [Shewanella sp. KX20019]|uniref:transposase n=1 Tax=Shewanella sp. KX20019 TaxID=2803864 RepID=UPI00192711D3|nr:transposase [Shewanella sp. KX20019]QQX78905.1 hypothetical protein JK628_15210 [Shewanella sp. KX20019]